MSEQNYSFLDATVDRELIQKLQTATQNLFWLSEAEYPWEIFYWHNADTFHENILLQQSNCSSSVKIAIQQLSDFFEPAIKLQSWHNDTEKAEVQRYQTLVNLITANLTDTKVYLLGEVEIDAYVLGTTKHNAIAGITTKIVRT